jgi:hypothetical protein
MTETAARAALCLFRLGTRGSDSQPPQGLSQRFRHFFRGPRIRSDWVSNSPPGLAVPAIAFAAFRRDLCALAASEGSGARYSALPRRPSATAWGSLMDLPVSLAQRPEWRGDTSRPKCGQDLRHDLTMSLANSPAMHPVESTKNTYPSGPSSSSPNAAVIGCVVPSLKKTVNLFSAITASLQ